MKITPVNKIDFLITRHAQSCNNAQCGQFMICKDFDTSITKTGMEEAKKLRKKTLFRSSIVCVSVLHRTWSTATLLYYRPGNNLSLYVCPFLKEKRTSPSNSHQSFAKSIASYKLFLDAYVKNMAKLGDKITIHIPVSADSDDYLEWKRIKWKPIVFKFDVYNPTCAYYDARSMKWSFMEVPEPCWGFEDVRVSNIDSTVDYTGYSTREHVRNIMAKAELFMTTKTGKLMFGHSDIGTFLEFASRNMDILCPSGKSRIFCVSHSGSMWYYLSRFHPKLVEKALENGIKKTNLWSIRKKGSKTDIIKGSSVQNPTSLCFKRKKSCEENVLCGSKYSKKRNRLQREITNL